jgi:hypothetical protein
LLKKLQQAVSKKSGKGILIVIDELGKFLEYEARHLGANDIFLLQALAELAYEGGEASILLLVMMHQAFEQYSKGLGANLKNEWVKVQGRFKSIPTLIRTTEIYFHFLGIFDDEILRNRTKFRKLLALNHSVWAQCRII